MFTHHIGGTVWYLAGSPWSDSAKTAYPPPPPPAAAVAPASWCGVSSSYVCLRTPPPPPTPKDGHCRSSALRRGCSSLLQIGHGHCGEGQASGSNQREIRKKTKKVGVESEYNNERTRHDSSQSNKRRRSSPGVREPRRGTNSSSMFCSFRCNELGGSFCE